MFRQRAKDIAAGFAPVDTLYPVPFERFLEGLDQEDLGAFPQFFVGLLVERPLELVYFASELLALLKRRGVRRIDRIGLVLLQGLTLLCESCINGLGTLPLVVGMSHVTSPCECRGDRRVARRSRRAALGNRSGQWQPWLGERQ